MSVQLDVPICRFLDNGNKGGCGGGLIDVVCSLEILLQMLPRGELVIEEDIEDVEKGATCLDDDDDGSMLIGLLEDRSLAANSNPAGS